MDLHPIDIALHLVNIVVLYLLLRIWVFKPVQKFMAGRQERIAKQIDATAKKQEKATRLEAELTEKLATVQDSCDQLMSESRQKGSDAAQKIIDNAETKARSILAETRQVAQAQRQQILDSAKVDLADLAITMAQRVLKFDQALLTAPVEEKEKTTTLSGVLKTAMVCDEDTLYKMKQMLENLLGAYLKLSVEVDADLMGGFAAYIDGQVYDFSYAAQLTAMKNSLN